jgi:hypothetical protein
MSVNFNEAQLVSAQEVDTICRWARATRYRVMRDDHTFPPASTEPDFSSLKIKVSPGGSYGVDRAEAVAHHGRPGRRRRVNEHSLEPVRP